jgi:hypothetical protein
MLYIFFSLVAASVFGIGAVAVYGHEGLIANPWIDLVFWWLIGTGVVLAALDYRVDLGCLICRRLTKAAPALCKTAPCGASA